MRLPGCARPTTRRKRNGQPFTPAERQVISPVMAELFTRADALTAATEYNLQDFVPQVRHGAGGQAARQAAAWAGVCSRPAKLRRE